MARLLDTAAPVTTERLPGAGSAPTTASGRQVTINLVAQLGMTRSMVTITHAAPQAGMRMIGVPATVRLVVTGREGRPAQPTDTDPKQGTEPQGATALAGFPAEFGRTGTDREVADGTARQLDGMRPAMPQAGTGHNNRPGLACPAIPRGGGMRNGAGPVCQATGTGGDFAGCQHRGTDPGHRMTHRATGGAGRREPMALT